MKTENNGHYYPALTGVRCVAAYLVFLHHYQPFTNTYFGRWLSPVNEFHTGVTFFFVLSGFLIANRYVHTNNCFRDYIIKRIARIYPIYFLLTVLTFLAGVTSISNPALYTSAFLANVSLLKGYFDDFVFTGIVQGWSLTTEETFYVIAPLLFFLLRTRRLVFWLSPILFTGLGILLVWLFQGNHFYGFMKSLGFMFSFTFFGRFVEFFAGIGLYIINRNLKRVSRFKIVTFVGILVIIFLLWWMHHVRGEHHFGVETVQGKVINNLILPIFGIAIFYQGLLTETTLLSKILSTKFLQLLGKSSYVFYLIHVGVIATFVSKFTGNILFKFVILNVMSIVMFKLIEEPLNILTRKILDRKRSGALTHREIL